MRNVEHVQLPMQQGAGQKEAYQMKVFKGIGGSVSGYGDLDCVRRLIYTTASAPNWGLVKLVFSQSIAFYLHISGGFYMNHDVENVVKVRTGEQGFDALQDSDP